MDRSSNSRGGSFRLGSLGLGSVNEAKVHTVVELGSVVDYYTQRESLLLGGDVDVDVDEETQKHQKKPLTNSLSLRQMKSLVALCDTILPSIIIDCHNHESVSTFYKTSASMAGTPHRVRTFKLFSFFLYMIDVVRAREKSVLVSFNI